MDEKTIASLSMFIQILTLLALIVYVIKTSEMASATRKSAEVAEKTVLEMQEARDQESAPYVIAYFDVLVGKNLIYLVVKNVGKSIATSVELTFDPQLQGGDISKCCKEFLTENVILSIPPNYEIRTIFETFSDYLRLGYPLCYNVTISYHGGINTESRVAQYKLDLSQFRGIAFVKEHDTGDVVKQIEKLVVSHAEVDG